MIDDKTESITIENFLAIFFSQNNRFQLEKINNPQDSQTKIKPWIEKLTQTEPQPTILPYWEENLVTWYALAFSERQLRNLSEKLMAFIGCTYSNFRGQRMTLNLDNPIELSIFRLTKGRVFILEGNTEKIWQKLEQMRRVEERREKIVTNITQSTDEIIKLFYTALKGNNREEAEKQLIILEEQNKLNFLNILFLKVELLAKLKQWQELLSLPQMSSLLNIRRPIAVTEALMGGIYNLELKKFEIIDAPSTALSYFQEVILPRYHNLFQDNIKTKSADVVKLVMLFAVSNSKSKLINKLLNISKLNEKDKLYLKKLAQLNKNSQSFSEINSLDTLNEVEMLMNNGQYQSAFNTLKTLIPSVKQVNLLLRCTYEIEDFDSRQIALTIFRKLSLQDQEQIKKSRWNREYLSTLEN